MVCADDMVCAFFFFWIWYVNYGGKKKNDLSLLGSERLEFQATVQACSHEKQNHLMSLDEEKAFLAEGMEQ